jgi:carbon storage regulator
MLVLSRKKGESVVVSLTDEVLRQLAAMPEEQRTIEVFAAEIRGDKARLGFEAPKVVPVHRREVFDAINRHNREKGRAA